MARAEGLREDALALLMQARAIADGDPDQDDLNRMEALVTEARAKLSASEAAFAAGDCAGGRPRIVNLHDGGLLDGRGTPAVARDITGQPIPFPGGPGSGFGGPGLARVLRPDQRIASVMPHAGEAGTEGLTVARMIRAMITGDHTGMPMFAAALGTGSGPAGGYLVPVPLAANLIDLARNQARVIQAGALTVPMTSSTLAIAKLTGDPSAEWKPENEPLSAASDMTFDRVQLQAKTLMAVAKVSLELAEDGQDVNGTIDRSISAALALQLDRAALRGVGIPGNDPIRGILSTDGIHHLEGLLTSYDSFSYAVEDIRTSNEEPNAVIYGAGVAGALDRLKDQTDQPLRPPDSFGNLRKFVSNQVDAEAYVADWTQLLLGMRTQVTIEASRVAGDGTTSAFMSGQVWIRAYLRADVALARPAAFAVIDGLGGVSS